MLTALVLLTLGGAIPAQTTSTSQARFAAPVRLMAGDKLLGVHRLFPSPVFHDVNGDGLADLVVGDLLGKLTVALRQPGADARAFGAESEIQAADGKPIDFHNW